MNMSVAVPSVRRDFVNTLKTAVLFPVHYLYQQTTAIITFGAISRLAVVLANRFLLSNPAKFLQSPLNILRRLTAPYKAQKANWPPLGHF